MLNFALKKIGKEIYPKAISFIKNFRFPQIIYHSGLLLIGVGFAIFYVHPEWKINWLDFIRFALLWLAIVAAWLASVVVNDFYDQKIDSISNPDRPLPSQVFSAREYFWLGMFLLASSLILAIIASWKAFFLLLLYQIIASFYSAPPLRLKKFAFVSTFVSAVASVMVLLAGFVLLASFQDISKIPLSFLLLLIFGYTFALPIKDFKDIEGDRADGVQTIPVFFGERSAKILIGIGIFISFLLSVSILQTPRLLGWAIFCGALSFLLVWNMKKPASGSWLHYRNIFWWMIGIISVYLMTMLFLVFLK